MHYVYQIESISHAGERYIGSTADLKARLIKHNEGGSPHTAKYRPWKLVSYQAFESPEKARAFEAYLKSGSGRAFAQRHIW
ncbi:GIY-YIG nuclease family protein [Synoicihabitans lomoniglobus]|uniref:GIY-YIG nuclease family protein n=1 Tax=Synoicihabitans lomoniglobus TaxID=2909285 RepID=A0AAF0CMH8_9BACT|nr:GIY-YIG nuclease family protein [Opitutaceae bacterium LMO-M01]WED63050.1 GIY-YIG nuclease family protein [Opitutaceae bacterium LMO-M01]